MQLIYSDESGINYQIKDGFFIDGPLIMYGGICIDDSKYFHLERMFISIIGDFFSIEDWRKENEIHASNIWNRKESFQNYNEIEIRNFFDEVLQLVTKLNLKTIIGIYPKTLSADKGTMDKENAFAIYSFFHLAEKHLSKYNDTGIIIADSKDSSNSNEENLFTRMFYDRTQWRTNPKSKNLETVKSKYKYESLSCFLLDNIHYVDSKKSLFNQIIDIILYINMRVFTFEKLRISQSSPALKEKVPVTFSNYKYYAKENLSIAEYFNEDVAYLDLSIDDTNDDRIYFDDLLRDIFQH